MVYSYYDRLSLIVYTIVQFVLMVRGFIRIKKNRIKIWVKHFHRVEKVSKFVMNAIREFPFESNELMECSAEFHRGNF